MSKHTPGPWRWCGRYLMQDIPGIDNPYSTPAGRPIADDGSAGGEYLEMIDIIGPDALLIAAAPKLLSAARSAFKWHRNHITDDCACGDSEGENGPFCYVARVLNEAIKKAEGAK